MAAKILHDLQSTLSCQICFSFGMCILGCMGNLEKFSDLTKVISICQIFSSNRFHGSEAVSGVVHGH